MILVTGASNILGKSIVQKLLNEGESVKILATNQELSKSFSTENISFHQGDILDVTDVYEAMADVDMVIHCDTIAEHSLTTYEKRIKYNVEGTANIVNAMLYHGVSKIIFISSIHTLGVDPEKIINEETKSEKNEWTTDPALSFMLAEREVWRGSVEGLEITIIHSAPIFLEDENLEYLYADAYKAIQKGNITLGNSDIHYVGLNDLTELIWRVSRQSTWNQKWIAIAESLPQLEFYRIISQYLGLTFSHNILNRSRVFFKISKDFIGSLFGKVRMYRRTNGRREMVKFRYDSTFTNDTFDMKWQKLSELLRKS